MYSILASTRSKQTVFIPATKNHNSRSVLSNRNPNSISFCWATGNQKRYSWSQQQDTKIDILWLDDRRPKAIFFTSNQKTRSLSIEQTTKSETAQVVKARRLRGNEMIPTNTKQVRIVLTAHTIQNSYLAFLTARDAQTSRMEQQKVRIPNSRYSQVFFQSGTQARTRAHTRMSTLPQDYTAWHQETKRANNDSTDADLHTRTHATCKNKMTHAVKYHKSVSRIKYICLCFQSKYSRRCLNKAHTYNEKSSEHQRMNFLNLCLVEKLLQEDSRNNQYMKNNLWIFF